jgi:hypothetical protein
MSNRPEPHRIEILAYQIWEERGHPQDSADADWAEAERRLSEDSEYGEDVTVTHFIPVGEFAEPASQAEAAASSRPDVRPEDRAASQADAAQSQQGEAGLSQDNKRAGRR